VLLLRHVHRGERLAVRRGERDDERERELRRGHGPGSVDEAPHRVMSSGPLIFLARDAQVLAGRPHCQPAGLYPAAYAEQQCTRLA
jgi:hypothetical protein